MGVRTVVMLNQGSVLAHTYLPELLSRFSAEFYQLTVVGNPSPPPASLALR